MQKFIDSTIKPFFIITGIGTAAAGMDAFFPRFTVENVQNLEFVQEYTIFVQHWGMMVCLMGVFMVGAALKRIVESPYPALQLDREGLHGVSGGVQCPPFLL